MNRTYKLAADPIKAATRTPRREILQITDDGHREVFVVVPNYCAVDVLEAIRRAYQDGREDRDNEDWEEALQIARRRAAGAAEQDESLTDVPMVCTTCRKPVIRSGQDWIHLHTADIGACIRPEGQPVRAMVAAGNERVPRDDGLRSCSRCGDRVGYLSSRDLCDGCEEEKIGSEEDEDAMQAHERLIDSWDERGVSGYEL